MLDVFKKLGILNIKQQQSISEYPTPHHCNIKNLNNTFLIILIFKISMSFFCFGSSFWIFHKSVFHPRASSSFILFSIPTFISLITLNLFILWWQIA